MHNPYTLLKSIAAYTISELHVDDLFLTTEGKVGLLIAGKNGLEAIDIHTHEKILFHGNPFSSDIPVYKLTIHQSIDGLVKYLKTRVEKKNGWYVSTSDLYAELFCLGFTYDQFEIVSRNAEQYGLKFYSVSSGYEIEKVH